MRFSLSGYTTMTTLEKPAVKERVLAMREAGSAYREIAAVLDIPIGSVRGWCHRAGLKVLSPLERLTAENEKLKARVAELEGQLAAIASRQGEQSSPVLGNDLYEMELVSLEEAKTKGLRRYYTGKPCSRGHLAPRTVCNRACVACAEERHRKVKA